MARRAAKAASRRSRQRRAKRATQLPPASAARPAEAVTAEPAEEASEEPRRPSPAAPSAPSPARAYAGGSSTLTARERAEYHYVERDLRNIGILTAILLALLIAAWFAFNALGLIG